LQAELAVQQASKEDEKADLEKQKEEYEAEQARIAAEEAAAAAAREQAAQEAAAQEAAAAEAATQEAAASESSTSNSTTSSATTNSSTTTDTTQGSSSQGSGSANTTPSTPANNNNQGSNNSSNGSSSTPAPAQTVNGSAIVAEAMKYIGTPYVWGGTTPDGFDCSGFTQYVFAKVGISLPRVTYAQEFSGTVISINEAKAGDLLFWGSRGSTHHVAIAMGNGQYVHAPTPGQNVSVSSYSYYSPDFAVRVN
jgi:cell wall-associated NlpC family hydrolase